jgi:hypothetical protein
MPAPSDSIGDGLIIGAFNPVENKALDIPTSHAAINEQLKLRASVDAGRPSVSEKTKEKEAAAGADEIQPAGAPEYEDDDRAEKDPIDEGQIIVTGSDAADFLLSIRDDGDPAITFRSMVLSTILSAFQAVMYQIYQVSLLAIGSAVN